MASFSLRSNSRDTLYHQVSWWYSFYETYLQIIYREKSRWYFVGIMILIKYDDTYAKSSSRIFFLHESRKGSVMLWKPKFSCLVVLHKKDNRRMSIVRAYLWSDRTNINWMNSCWIPCDQAYAIQQTWVNSTPGASLFRTVSKDKALSNFIRNHCKSFADKPAAQRIPAVNKISWLTPFFRSHTWLAHQRFVKVSAIMLSAFQLSYLVLSG